MPFYDYDFAKQWAETVILGGCPDIIDMVKEGIFSKDIDGLETTEWVMRVKHRQVELQDRMINNNSLIPLYIDFVARYIYKAVNYAQPEKDVSTIIVHSLLGWLDVLLKGAIFNQSYRLFRTRDTEDFKEAYPWINNLDFDCLKFYIMSSLTYAHAFIFDFQIDGEKYPFIMYLIDKIRSNLNKDDGETVLYIILLMTACLGYHVAINNYWTIEGKTHIIYHENDKKFIPMSFVDITNKLNNNDVDLETLPEKFYNILCKGGDFKEIV